MAPDARVRLAVLVTTALASVLLITLFFFATPSITSSWVVALATLLGLGLLSSILALRVTEAGVTSSTIYIPYLAAIVLAGPAGAGALAAVTHLIDQALIERKPLDKTAFNTSQTVLAVGTAGLIYSWLGGNPSLTELNVEQSALPFLVSAAAYFLLNRAAVSWIMSLSEYGGVREMWRRILGNVILFDIAMSPIAFFVAFLFIWLGPWGLVFAVIPILGLRYIYGASIELRQLNRDLLRVLIKTLEAQDPYTSGHSIRVAERAKILAKELGLALPEIHLVETAALLHDIGKIDNQYHDLLRQEGPLTEEQKELIEDHPERGVRIIESVRSLDPKVLGYVKHHHERFDGDGYPDGLEGKEIPLGARIIMVSDTIDAMRKARPYRDALPLVSIRKELLRCRGSQFDPDVVDAAIAAGLLDEESEIEIEVSHTELSLRGFQL